MIVPNRLVFDIPEETIQQKLLDTKNTTFETALEIF